MTKVYWRCNSGHYFCNLHCPFDGWSSPELDELYGAVQRLESKRTTPNLAALRAEGVGSEAMKRVIVVEFGNEKAIFDAISPDYYVIAGKALKLTQVSLDFL